MHRLLAPCLFLLVGGCGAQDSLNSPCRLDDPFGGCWLPVTAQEFAGNWPLAVDAGELRCHRVEPTTVPVFRPAGSKVEYSFAGTWSRDLFPNLFDADVAGLWMCDPRFGGPEPEPGCLRVLRGDFEDWAESVCGPVMQAPGSRLSPHPDARRRSPQ